MWGGSEEKSQVEVCWKFYLFGGYWNEESKSILKMFFDGLE